MASTIPATSLAPTAQQSLMTQRVHVELAGMSFEATFLELRALLNAPKEAQPGHLVSFLAQCKAMNVDPALPQANFFISSETGNIVPVFGHEVYRAKLWEWLDRRGYVFERLENESDGNKGWFRLWVKGRKEPLIEKTVKAETYSTGKGGWASAGKRVYLLEKQAAIVAIRQLGIMGGGYSIHEIPEIPEDDRKRLEGAFAEADETLPIVAPLQAAQEATEQAGEPEPEPVSNDDLSGAARAREESPTSSSAPTPAPSLEQAEQAFPGSAEVCGGCGEALLRSRKVWLETPQGQACIEKFGARLCAKCVAQA